MKPPAIRKSLRLAQRRNGQNGVTILLVAAAIVAIMAMAALSIDAVTLYLASANAQQAADSSALAGARILSLSGMTGDPQNESGRWSAACTSAEQVASAVGSQITVGGTQPASVIVTFPNDPSGNCNDGAGTFTIFGVNPQVQVKIQSVQLPTFFARIWGRTGSSVSATATAEVFNPSGSGNHTSSGSIIPVRPRCVKPWIIPNMDPGNGGTTFVNPNDGSIVSPGIKLSGAGAGVIGESFTLVPDCKPSGPCSVPGNLIPRNPPTANGSNLDFVPAPPPSTSTAVPSACGNTSAFQQAIAGCDQTTVYQCGVQDQNTVDLGVHNVPSDTADATQCLINHVSSSTDEDSLDTTIFPYQVKAGTNSPLTRAGVASNTVITSSNSIVTVPIYDSGPPSVPLNPIGTTSVTIVGFLQVFINSVNSANGNLNVTVLNVSGCGNGNNSTGTAVLGSSPVPVRLITNP